MSLETQLSLSPLFSLCSFPVSDVEEQECGGEDDERLAVHLLLVSAHQLLGRLLGDGAERLAGHDGGGGARVHGGRDGAARRRRRDGLLEGQKKRKGVRNGEGGNGGVLEQYWRFVRPDSRVRGMMVVVYGEYRLVLVSGEKNTVWPGFGALFKTKR